MICGFQLLDHDAHRWCFLWLSCLGFTELPQLYGCYILPYFATFWFQVSLSHFLSPNSFSFTPRLTQSHWGCLFCNPHHHNPLLHPHVVLQFRWILLLSKFTHSSFSLSTFNPPPMNFWFQVLHFLALEFPLSLLLISNLFWNVHNFLVFNIFIIVT